MPTYLDRLLSKKCTRCPADAVGDSSMCPRCAAYVAGRKRRSNEKRRGTGRRGRCVWCVRKAERGKQRCKVCAAKHRVAEAVRKAERKAERRGVAVVWIRAVAETDADRFTTDGDARVRFHGQGRHKRGRIASKAINRQDLDWAIAEIVKARDGLAILDSAAAEIMTASEKEQHRQSRAAQLRLAQGFCDDVLDRLPARAQGGKRK